VEAVLQPPLASTEALVFALRERGSASTDWKLMEPEQQLNVSTEVAAFRVPAAPLTRFRAGGSFRAEDAGYALVQHVWLVGVPVLECMCTGVCVCIWRRGEGARELVVRLAATGYILPCTPDQSCNHTVSKAALAAPTCLPLHAP
jgi:hypothetical protein